MPHRVLRYQPLRDVNRFCSVFSPIATATYPYEFTSVHKVWFVHRFQRGEWKHTEPDRDYADTQQPRNEWRNCHSWYALWESAVAPLLSVIPPSVMSRPVASSSHCLQEWRLPWYRIGLFGTINMHRFCEFDHM